MAKIKIHEIAKKINVSSKEVLDKAIDLGINVKTHLSGIEEEEAKKIEASFAGKVKQEKLKEKPKKEVKEKVKEAPVIIRRQVIMEEPVKKANPVKKTPTDKGIGFVERERKQDYNIVYRNKQTKPLNISELFGKKEEPKTQPASEAKVETKKVELEKTVVEEKRPEVSEPQEETVKVEVKTNTQKTETPKAEMPRENNNFGQYNNPNRQFNNRNNGQNNYQNRPYNRDNQGNRNFNNDRNNQNRPFNRDRQNNNYNNNRPYNNRNNNGNYNNNYNRQNRNLDERGIEKNIRNIMTSDIPEKENVREYANKAIDKQKVNSKYDDNRSNKKNNKSRRNSFEEISSHKLKDLKQEKGLSNMFTEGSMLDYYDLTTTRGKKNKKKVSSDENRIKQKIFQLTDITIPDGISVKDLSTELKKTSGEIIKKLLSLGIMATINNEIDFDTAFLISEEFGVTAHKKEVVTDEDILFDDSEDREEDLMPRPPVVVVMGHVDHGKTSLLDAVRSTNVIEGEAGGITQHIGAYKVKINDREITFLDTPGHEAFTAMRARGAQITDIAILVVAANDGVMPQTVEAINHAKSAGIPIIVAVNKIDLPDANIDKVKQELMAYELVPEEWGGETICVPISAKNNTNIDQLLEMVLLQADVLELKANPHKQSKGVVIEARLDKAKGAIATMLVQRGTLDVGDTIIVGSSIGRIRAMTNENGKKVKSAGPSTPVEIMGLTEVPEAGDIFYEVKDEKTAKHLIEKRKREAREKAIGAGTKVTLDNLFEQMEEGNLKHLNLIVKADVQGSVEAVKQSMEKLQNEEVKVKVIHAAPGAVNESDVTLAKVSNAIIIGFNVRPELAAEQQAKKEKVDMRLYSVIYDAINDVETALKGLMPKKYKEVKYGTAEVRKIFKITGVGIVAGCYVKSGKILRGAMVRLVRDNIVLLEIKIDSLKREKDDVKEVNENYECGIKLENYSDIKEGDIFECFTMEEVK